MSARPASAMSGCSAANSLQRFMLALHCTRTTHDQVCSASLFCSPTSCITCASASERQVHALVLLPSPLGVYSIPSICLYQEQERRISREASPRNVLDLANPFR